GLLLWTLVSCLLMHSFFRKSADKIESKRLQYYKTVPFGRLWPLYAAVFCLFAVTGFFGDLMNLGRMPHVVVILNAIFSGLVALMYLHVGVRLAVRYSVRWGGNAASYHRLLLAFYPVRSGRRTGVVSH